MPGFGPFKTYSDALIAACPLVMKLPHSVAGRPSDPNFQVYWRTSREYCAWIYYTPNDTYEMSMLTVAAIQDDPGKRKCLLPAYVSDARYPPDRIGYVFVVHNHPFSNVLSDNDIRFIVNQGSIHEFVVETKTRKVPIGIVAFFSTSAGPGSGSCDGFYEYLPATGEVLKWTVQATGEWREEAYGTIKWLSSTDYELSRADSSRPHRTEQ